MSTPGDNTRRERVVDETTDSGDPTVVRDDRAAAVPADELTARQEREAEAAEDSAGV